jgi:hypothetical protein
MARAVVDQTIEVIPPVSPWRVRPLRTSRASVNPIQRFWRDLETAARHPSPGTELSREVYGRALVGGQEQVSFLI